MYIYSNIYRDIHMYTYTGPSAVVKQHYPPPVSFDNLDTICTYVRTIYCIKQHTICTYVRTIYCIKQHSPPPVSFDIPDDDDDVYLDKLQTRGVKRNLSSTCET
jgi:hypothetical protein